MNKSSLFNIQLIAWALLFTLFASAQTSWYVATDGTGNGTSWADATNSIQGAIDASTAGDTIWVTNGLYNTDVIEWPLASGQNNRVAVNKIVTVRSADNDPANTIIDGSTVARCVYLLDGSSLIGFTLKNGLTPVGGEGGGVYCNGTPLVSNCVMVANTAGYGGGVFFGILRNCTLSNNTATAQGGGARASTLYDCTLSKNLSHGDGGGAMYGSLYDCVLTNNTANRGGAVMSSSLYNCELLDNIATAMGGGAAYSTIVTNCTLSGNHGTDIYVLGGGAANSTLYNCTLSENSGRYGGGAYASDLYNCTIVSNTGTGGYPGSGVHGGTLRNCLIIGNKGASLGGGADSSTLINCTIAHNSSITRGGGVHASSLTNCIVYFNSSPDGANWSASDTTVAFDNSCTFPAVTGNGNISGNPSFVDTNTLDYRLKGGSPCINKGANASWMTSAYDLDGNNRILNDIVDMGAYETLLTTGTLIVIH